MNDVWRDHSKHIFVLTSAGKPVFCRYGNDFEQTSITSVISAVVGRTLDTADPAKCVAVNVDISACKDMHLRRTCAFGLFERIHWGGCIVSLSLTRPLADANDFLAV